MSLSGLLGAGSPGGRKLCIFEIRPDQDFIVFRGPPGETPDAKLKGSIVLMTNESLNVKNGIKLVFEGRRKTQHFVTRLESHSGLPATSAINNKSTFIHQEVRIMTDVSGHSFRSLPPGNHSFPFEFHLPGDTPESIEGLPGHYITYDLKAICERGVLSKDMSTRKHVRIIRTLGPDALESAAASAVHGVWPDKIKYLFEPVSKTFIFGTSLATDLELTPLLDKLSIEKITFTLKEVRKIKTDPGPDYSPSSGKYHGMWKEEQDIFSDSMPLPEGSLDTDTDTQLPMYKFRATWQLPKSLLRCRQSVEEGEWIQIKHHAHFDILLRNPDGHLSELKAHHPIRLFISPNLPFDESNTIATPDGLHRDENDPLDMTAPPTYGTHQLDVLVPLYDGIDPSGYLTPGTTSGAASPFRFHSRNASAENLGHLVSSDGHANPLALSSRLRNLQMTNEGSMSRPGSHVRPHERTPDDSLSPQRSHSPGGTDHESVPTTPYHHPAISPGAEEHVDYDMNALGRMPSYNTAMKASARNVRPESPPTYATATSRPPSPQSHAPLAPERAYMRGVHSS